MDRYYLVDSVRSHRKEQTDLKPELIAAGLALLPYFAITAMADFLRYAADAKSELRKRYYR
jgi:hypothetical protein